MTIPVAPSSSTAMSAPVSCWMVLMTLPLGPITSPTLSKGIVKDTIFGAVSATVERGALSAAFMLSRIVIRASRACCKAADNTSAGIPSILVSSCKAVTQSTVPATLKSMSPNASSAPRMSVSATYSVLPSTTSETRPIAIPATGARKGTPALRSAMVEAQTEPMDVEPFEPSASDT
ncbi:unannotated protein [freshwater metagenome]|uniref:Unannotated protein n=1 Tax=freshwater metagenome TaxID=449393 RepID=A0A6J7UYM4_9ZZZZ